MKILLTNDDGYNQVGINITKEILKEFGEVFVVAPSKHQSGKGCSLTINQSQSYIKHDDHNYELDGTPVDCVIFALSGLKLDVDLVVSGCNNGYNLSYDAMYSGTVGACFQASIFNKKSLALSTGVNHFKIIENDLKKVLEHIFKNDLLSIDYLLNVNFPAIEYNNIKGIKITKQCIRKVIYNFTLENGKTSNRRIDIGTQMSDEDDLKAIKDGYVSITPLAKTTFDIHLYESLVGKAKDK